MGTKTAGKKASKQQAAADAISGLMRRGHMLAEIKFANSVGVPIVVPSLT